MSGSPARILALLALLCLASFPAVAMPPHPALVARIRAGEIDTPYALSHRAELQYRGVDIPSARVPNWHGAGSLDEPINILAILVDFDDHGAQVPAINYDSLLFGNAAGSLRHFYSEVSYGTLSLVTVNTPGDLGWRRAPQDYAYYVDGQNGFGDYPQNAQGMTEDAVMLANADVNYADYDNDGDGMVDALFIIHSGRGAESSGNDNDIWSHKWQLPTPLHLDGVDISIYSMEPEFTTTAGDATCGVYAHEMGHSVFGLPDLYDTDYGSEGLGRWSLMAGGSWNGGGASPAHPDAQSRLQMGFANAINVTANLFDVSIPPVENQPVIYRLWTRGVQGDEYFLVENRQRTGYDRNLPGSGLLIYHVDLNKWGNTQQWFPGLPSASHYRVALEQADGLWSLEHNSNQGDSGDPFPGAFGRVLFSSLTVPNSHAYNDTDTEVSVRRVAFTDGNVVTSLVVDTSNLLFVVLPMDSVTADTISFVPVAAENSVTELDITTLDFTVLYDSALVTLATPAYSLAGSLIPETWNLSVDTDTPGRIHVAATGDVALDGAGSFLTLRFRALPTALDQALSPLRFENFTYPGSALIDTVNGSLRVLAPDLVAYPADIVFDSLTPGQPMQMPFVMRNYGQTWLRVDSVVCQTSRFTTDFDSVRMIESRHWIPVRVNFTPPDSGLYSDTLTIYSNNPLGVVRVVARTDGNANPVAPGPVGSLPIKLYLSQNYPNPFNAQTIFRFGLPAATRGSLRLYDILGREVATLADGVLSAGEHRLAWDGSHCAAGVYLAVLSGDGFRVVQKAILLK